MRAAAFFAASLVVMGAWIVLAAALAVSAPTIAIGLLAIVVLAAIGHMVTGPVTASPSGSSARSGAREKAAHRPL